MVIELGLIDVVSGGDTIPAMEGRNGGGVHDYVWEISYEYGRPAYYQAKPAARPPRHWSI